MVVSENVITANFLLKEGQGTRYLQMIAQVDHGSVPKWMVDKF